MTILAVEEFPNAWRARNVAGLLSESVKTRFIVLDFEYINKSNKFKRCFIKLPPTTDANYVMKCIKKIHLESFGYLNTYVVKKLPSQVKQDPGGYITNIEVLTPDEILLRAHWNICVEMLHKYTGLEKLSEKTSHLLLDRLAYVLYKRLQLIIDTKPHDVDTCFKLSKLYRRLYPHYTDFQCILANLHKIEGPGNESEIVEEDLVKVQSSPYNIEDVPCDEVKKSCEKFTDLITKTISDHISGIDVEMSEGTQFEGDSANEEVMRELHALQPYLPYMVKNTFSHYFEPKDTDPIISLRIYGEPFLPSKTVMHPITVKYRPVSVMRCPYMFNLIEIAVKPAYYGRLIATDGTIISGAKLVIRPVPTIKWKVPNSLKAEMREFYGIAPDKKYEDKHDFRDVVDDIVHGDDFEYEL